MKYTKILVLSLSILSAVVARATPFTLDSVNSDLAAGPGESAPPWSLDVDLTFDLSDPDGSDSWTLDNWSFTLSSGTLGPFRSVILQGFHNVAPHAGEIAPSNPFFGGVIFPSTPSGGGSAFGDISHNAGRFSGHLDSWNMHILVNEDGQTATIKVQAFHPEATNVWDGGSTYLLLSSTLTGLGLIRRKMTFRTH